MQKYGVLTWFKYRLNGDVMRIFHVTMWESLFPPTINHGLVCDWHIFGTITGVFNIRGMVLVWDNMG